MKRIIGILATLILIFSFPTPKSYALSGEEKIVVKAVERANSSVVTIIGESTGEELFRPSSILMNFFTIVMQSREKDNDDKTISVGSGVIVDRTEKDPNRELAVLHIERNNLKEAALSNSDHVKIGPRQNENIGFAIPINEAKNMLTDYKRFGKL